MHTLHHTPHLSNCLPTPDWKINCYQLPPCKTRFLSYLPFSFFFFYLYRPCPCPIQFSCLFYFFFFFFVYNPVWFVFPVKDNWSVYSPYGIYTHIMSHPSIVVTTLVLQIALVFSHLHFHSRLTSSTKGFKLQCFSSQLFELYFFTT